MEAWRKALSAKRETREHRAKSAKGAKWEDPRFGDGLRSSVGGRERSEPEE